MKDYELLTALGDIDVKHVKAADFPAKKTGRRLRKGLLIAAVVAVLGIGITAMASDLWNNTGKGYHPAMYEVTEQAVVYENGEPSGVITESPEDAANREHDPEHPVVHIGEYIPCEDRTYLPFMLDENDPQYQAMVEWNEALLKSDPYYQDFALADLFFGNGARYPSYDALSPQMEENLEKIAEKYDLELVTWKESNSQELADEITALGLTNYPVNSDYGDIGFTYCSDGSFWYSAPVNDIGQPGEWAYVRVWHVSRSTMPMEYWTVILDPDTEVTTFTIGDREGYVYRAAHGVTFLMRFDDAYAVAGFRVDGSPDSDPDRTTLTDEDVQMLCGAINWEKFEDLGLKESRLHENAAALHAERTPKSTSPDLDHPYYGTFKHEGIGTIYEYYPDHFSRDGVRYDDPVYTVTGTYDFIGTGKYIYTFIDADCGDGVHYTIVTFAATRDRLGFFENSITMDALSNRHIINSRRQ